MRGVASIAPQLGVCRRLARQPGERHFSAELRKRRLRGTKMEGFQIAVFVIRSISPTDVSMSWNFGAPPKIIATVLA
jgi:hypothetical protein